MEANAHLVPQRSEAEPSCVDEVAHQRRFEQVKLLALCNGIDQAASLALRHAAQEVEVIADLVGARASLLTGSRLHFTGALLDLQVLFERVVEHRIFLIGHPVQSLLLFHVSLVLLREQVGILVPQLKHRAVEWRVAFRCVFVERWPLEVADGHCQDLRLEQCQTSHFFLEQYDQIVGEEVRIDCLVLVLRDVVDHQVQRLDLIHIYGRVDG